MKDSRLTKENVLEALRHIQDPELHKDLVSLNMVREIEILGDKVNLTITLTTPACPLKTEIEKDVRRAIMALGARTVDLKVDANVPNDGKTRGLLSLPVRNVVAIASGKGGVGKAPLQSTSQLPSPKVEQGWDYSMQISMGLIFPS